MAVNLLQTQKGSGDGEHRRTFLIGAGDGGALFMDSYQHPTSELELVGILDKDSKKKGQKLGGIPVWVHMMICLN